MCKKSKIFLTALSHRLHGTWLKHAILHVTIITKVLEFLFLTGDYITRSYFWVIPSFQPYIDIIAVGKYKPSSNLHLYDSFNARYNAQSPTIKEKYLHLKTSHKGSFLNYPTMHQDLVKKSTKYICILVSTVAIFDLYIWKTALDVVLQGATTLTKFSQLAIVTKS